MYKNYFVVTCFMFILLMMGLNPTGVVFAQSQATTAGSLILSVGTAGNDAEIFSSAEPVDVLITVQANAINDVAGQFASGTPVVIPRLSGKISLKADGVELKALDIDGTSRAIFKRGVKSISVGLVSAVSGGVTGSYQMTILTTH